MNWLAAVRSLWEGYIAKAEQLERDRKPGEGLLGLTPGPKNDPCHERFAENAQKLLDDMLAAGPSSAEVREVLAYIYRAPLEHREPLTAYWMLLAVHNLTTALASRLDRADAQALRDEYAKLYRRRDRLPAQKKVLASLEAAGR